MTCKHENKEIVHNYDDISQIAIACFDCMKILNPDGTEVPFTIDENGNVRVGK